MVTYSDLTDSQCRLTVRYSCARTTAARGAAGAHSATDTAFDLDDGNEGFLICRVQFVKFLAEGIVGNLKAHDSGTLVNTYVNDFILPFAANERLSVIFASPEYFVRAVSLDGRPFTVCILLSEAINLTYSTPNRSTDLGLSKT